MTDSFDRIPASEPGQPDPSYPSGPPPAPPADVDTGPFLARPSAPGIVPPGPVQASPPPAEDGAGFAVPAAPLSAIGAGATRGSTASGGYGRFLWLVLIPVVAIVTFAGGVAMGRSGVLGTDAVSSAAPTSATAPGEMALIEEAWRTIHDNYVDAKNLDDRDLAYGAIRGMTEAVGDEGHTSFLTADEAKAADQSLSGTFVGIGVQINADDEDDAVPTISSVIPNTPAEEADLRRGDRIVAVGDWKTDGHTVEEVVSRVRGPDGEPVTLTISREGRGEFDVTITRREFDLPLVSWAMVPGRDVAMIRLEQFATGATKAIEGAIGEAKDAGATGIILDLRGNPGGYVNEAIGVTSQFVGEGIVYRSIDASGATKDVPVTPGGAYTSGPLVVLADAASASSAEIVTGAIQDAKRGTVVGDKTFGTGTVLGRFDLTDGSSMRIGVERWLTRGGRPIWHEGLEPDVKIVLPDDATPLRPDDLRDLTAAGLAASPDVQVQKALEELSGEG
ncbi:MAG TPA: S41 family peptidase [Candidatus Limnocylindrales bacterium]|nr:S41 family peptidase [Candidatus Limnocylindrales bacterium]